MKVCRWCDVHGDIAKQIRNKSLIPILGAGFSAGATTNNGRVPSGKDLKNEMLLQIKKTGNDVSRIEEIEDLKKIALYYKAKVSESIRKKYLLNNFTEVKLLDFQKDFLSIKWPYIYTFNIDTAIEDNSDFKNIILPNKVGETEVIKRLNNCVFKMHGDVNEYCRYKDSSCYIFDYKEYAKSIEKNKYLINKIKHDLTNNNVIFIGCSLTDELDLLSLDFMDEPIANVSRYYITTEKPDAYKEIELEQYGITHVVIVEEYSTFYHSIFHLYKETQKVQTDELDKFRNNELVYLPNIYEKNINYIYLGKMNYDSKSSFINIPSFFVDRGIVIDNIIPEMQKYTVQCICGGRVSGKSYALLSIIKNIKNRDVFYFDSRFSINTETFDRLLNEKNCILCFDTACITTDQWYKIKNSIYKIKQNGTNIVMCINRSEKDIISTIKSMEEDVIQIYDLKNKFSSEEANAINKSLSIMAIPNVNCYKSILDNLLIISKQINVEYKRRDFALSINNKYEMMVLILLAIQEKLTSQELVEFKIMREAFDIYRKVSPIIDEDYTDIIERDIVDSSPYKIYVNSRYWLLSKLGSYATDVEKHELITSAYKEIVRLLIDNHSIKYSMVEDYIKYDIINEIFFKEKPGNLALIKKLYDELNDLLADNPQFHHQKAKCYLWHSSYAENETEEVEQSLRFAKVARHNLALRANKNNEKVLISLSHIDFTIALIYAKKSTLDKYDNIDVFKDALAAIHLALISPYNKEYCTNLIRRNEKKINDIKAFIIYAQTTDMEKYKFNHEEKRQLDDLIMRGYGFK
ncbi:SIR2 family protein [[Clostridium] hylemonae]|uniref:SIR2 family protein n=1 Tax=[Clostridium] hylemonae TaxID=89153 RepID=UPI00110736C5|nr:SIR2 family protein [[Clostridium] hylemonae]